MLIDWFTVIAQAINFLILIALLKYFLYGRIMAAMERRQQEIQSRWDEADRSRTQAEAELEAARQQRAEIADRRETLLAEARDNVESERRQMLADARSEVDGLRTRWEAAVHEQTSSFLRDLRHAAATGVCEIAGRALADLADRELEACIVRTFLDRIRTLDHAQRKQFNNDSPVTIKTAIRLTPQLRAEVTDTLREEFGSSLDIDYVDSADLECGIAIVAGGHKIAWSLQGYLDSLEQHVTRMLEDEVGELPLPAANAG